MGNIFGSIDEGDEELTSADTGTGLDFVHVKQSSTWDCGIACSTMALRWVASCNQNINVSPMTNSKSTPLWTIDLYVFLRERGVRLNFSTSLKGVNAEHDSLKWYAGHIDEDRSRVEALFRQIDASCIDKAENAVPTAELADMLKSQAGTPLNQREVAAIVLVNNLYLKADSRRGGTGVPPAADYEGHYIFAIGFDSQNNDMLYLDPAKNCEIHRCGLNLFDQARRAPGTDMDLLVIKR